MGYVRNNIYRLKFQDEQYEGLVIHTRSAPVKELMELAKLAEIPAAELTSEAGFGAMSRLIAGFSKALVSWNLETLADLADDDSERIPVPANVEGVESQDFEFILAVIVTWIEAIAGVAAPLANGSNSGGTVPVGSIPMETLSASQAS